MQAQKRLMTQMRPIQMRVGTQLDPAAIQGGNISVALSILAPERCGRDRNLVSHTRRIADP